MNELILFLNQSMMDNSDTHVAQGPFVRWMCGLWLKEQFWRGLVIYGKEFLQGRRAFELTSGPEDALRLVTKMSKRENNYVRLSKDPHASSIDCRSDC